LAETLGVLVTTFNVEETVRACLESVKWADDLLVVDSYSTDKTLEIAREYTDRIVEHEYKNAATQRNWALPQVKGDWVLVIDSDECLTPELAARMQEILKNGTPCNGFRIKRMTIFFGKLIRHCGWHRQYVVRLWRNGKAEYQDRWVHPQAVVDGEVGTIHEHILHDTFRNFDDYIERFGRYTTWSSRDLYRKGRKPSWVNLTLRPLWRFLRMYVFRHGFLDGKHGLILCTLAAFYVFTKYAKLWDRHRLETGGDAADTLSPPEQDKARELGEGLTGS